MNSTQDRFVAFAKNPSLVYSGQLSDEGVPHGQGALAWRGSHQLLYYG